MDFGRTLLWRFFRRLLVAFGGPGARLNRFYRFSGLRGRLTSAGKTQSHIFFPNKTPKNLPSLLQHDPSKRQIGSHVDQCGPSLMSNYIGVELAIYEPVRESLIGGKTLARLF